MEDEAMKRLLILLPAIGYCLAIAAFEPVDTWVNSGANKTDCKRISVGTSKARIVLQNGDKVVVPLDQIDSYSADGKVFNKVELYRNGKPANKLVFMELLKTRDGYELYRYNICDLDITDDQYFVYKGDEFALALDEKMNKVRIERIFKYFGLGVIFK